MARRWKQRDVREAYLDEAMAIVEEADIEAAHEKHTGPGPHARTDFDALSVWFTLHGLATVMESRVVDTLELTSDMIDRMAPEILRRIGWMLGIDEDT
jgi:hypothetical protein